MGIVDLRGFRVTVGHTRTFTLKLMSQVKKRVDSLFSERVTHNRTLDVGTREQKVQRCLNNWNSYLMWHVKTNRFKNHTTNFLRTVQTCVKTFSNKWIMAFSWLFVAAVINYSHEVLVRIDKLLKCAETVQIEVIEVYCALPEQIWFGTDIRISGHKCKCLQF